jgi:hypothetical protein
LQFNKSKKSFEFNCGKPVVILSIVFDERGIFFPMEGLDNLLIETSVLPPCEMCDAIIEHILNYSESSSARFHDDMTILTFDIGRRSEK